MYLKEKIGIQKSEDLTDVDKILQNNLPVLKQFYKWLALDTIKC